MVVSLAHTTSDTQTCTANGKIRFWNSQRESLIRGFRRHGDITSAETHRMNHEYEAFLIDGFSHIRPDHLGAIAITGSTPRAGINAQGSSTRSEPPEEGFLQTLLLISFPPSSLDPAILLPTLYRIRGSRKFRTRL